MYSDEYEDEEQSEQENGGFIANFYNNNKVLVWIFLGIIIFIILMSLLTNGGKNTAVEKKNYDVVIYPEEEVVISIGTSTNLIATVKSDPNATITWSVEDEKIAKVDNGNVTGLGYGKTKVTATYVSSDDEKHSQTKDITIADGDPSITLTGVSFKDGDLFMPLNSTYRIALTITPQLGYIEYKSFVSSNESVVTVDNTGLVTAIGEGEATINVDVNGIFKNELKVYVDRNYNQTEIIVTPEKISFDGELRKIKVGTTDKLSFATVPENADRSKLTWESSDNEILTVNENGRITALKEGKAVVTVTSINGTNDKIDVEVESDVIPVTDISLSMSDITLAVGQSQTITPVVSPDNASNKALSFMSMDNSVVTAVGNETGTQATITGVSAGSTSIIVKSANDVEVKLNVTITGSSIAPTPSNGGSDGGGGNSATIKVRVNGNDTPDKSCSGQTLKYYSNPSITITLNGGVGKVEYCYGTGKCTPNITASSTTTFTLTGNDVYTLRIKKYDRSGNEIASSDSGNYRDGALEYYINTKAEGATCTGTGASSATCENNTTATACLLNDKCEWNYSYGCRIKCESISTASDCSSRSDCTWNYSSGCKTNSGSGSSTPAPTQLPLSTPAPTQSSKVIITCVSTEINPGETTTCNVTVPSGDSIKTWLKNDVDQQINYNPLELTGNTPGVYKWTVVTNQGLRESVNITIKGSGVKSTGLTVTLPNNNMTQWTHGNRYVINVSAAVEGTYSISASGCTETKMTKVDWLKANEVGGIEFLAKEKGYSTITIKFTPKSSEYKAETVTKYISCY